MRRPRPVLRFLAIFLVVYGGLIAPWPAWRPLYRDGFVAFCGRVLSVDNPRSVVRIEVAPPGRALDARIILLDPRKVDLQGRASGLILGLDTRGIGWIPTAFLCALVLASQVPWRRRLRALAVGLAVLYLYLLLAVQVYIWNRSLPDAATLKWIAAALEETMVTQIGPSFVVPAVIWILVTFRREDLDAGRDWLGIGRRPPPSQPGA